MNKNILTVLGLCLLLVVGVYFKHQEEPTELDKQKVAATNFVSALKSANVDKVLSYSNDVRFSSQEERRKFLNQQFEQDKFLNAGIAGYLRDGKEQHMYAAVWFETEHMGKQQFNIPLIEEKGRWKLLLGQDDLQASAIQN